MRMETLLRAARGELAVVTCTAEALLTRFPIRAELEKRIRRARRQIRRAKGVDVVITHAAPTGCGDRKDPAHLGFDCFRDLMDRYKPGYLIHGHVHMNYDSDISRTMQYGETTVVNAYERYVLDLPDRG